MMIPKDISTKHGVHVTHLKPALPHTRSSVSHVYRDQNAISKITSDGIILFGINDCLNQYINEYKTFFNQTEAGTLQDQCAVNPQKRK